MTQLNFIKLRFIHIIYYNIIAFSIAFFKPFVISTGKLLTYDRYLTRGVDSVFNIKNDTVAPHIIDSLSHIYNKTFFIVQLYQSHMYYENFAPRFNRWHPNHITEPESKSPDLFLNAYDNTILHGDEVLSDIIRVINRSGACSTFLFASDHGEELSMHGQQRGMGLHPRIVEYNPAMFFWYSDKWENKHPEGASRINRLKHSPVNAEDFFYTACDMADISISKKYAHPEYSWLSGKYRFHKRRILLPNGISVIDAAEKNFLNQEKSVNQ